MVRMMRNVLLVLAIIFLIGCQPAVVQQKNVTVTECKQPYYEYSPGDCCLDAEPNQICDRYENSTLPQINKTIGPQTPKNSHISDAMIKFRQKVTGYSYQEGETKYLVRGNLVRIEPKFIKKLDMRVNRTIPVTITDIFIDRSEKKAVGYCDPRREGEILGEFDPDRSNCARIIDMEFVLPYVDYNPILPEDWLTRFSYASPTVAQANDQYVKDLTGWKAVNPVLTFVENGDEYTLHLEMITGLPIKVNVKEGDRARVISYSDFTHNMVKQEEMVYQKFAK
jgi:hypothetical protein